MKDMIMMDQFIIGDMLKSNGFQCVKKVGMHTDMDMGTGDMRIVQKKIIIMEDTVKLNKNRMEITEMITDMTTEMITDMDMVTKISIKNKFNCLLQDQDIKLLKYLTDTEIFLNHLL